MGMKMPIKDGSRSPAASSPVACHPCVLAALSMRRNGADSWWS